MLTHRLRLVLVLASCGLAPIASATVKVDESVVAPVRADAAYVISPAGLRVATVTMKGSRHVVLIDGVEGPLFDALLQLNGQTYHPRGSGMSQSGQLPVVLFSPDGKRVAYVARLGEEMVIVVDGKEYARLPNSINRLARGPVRFSPSGQHLFYVNSDPNTGSRLVLNGQAGPALTGPPTEMAFSADGKRWAYVAPSAAGQTLVVDGKATPGGPVTYDQLMFTADGRFVCAATGPEGASLMVDGKVAVRAAAIRRIVAAPVGRRLAALVVKPGAAQSLLWLDGKEIAATEGALEVTFSPDGQRYAALCQRSGGTPHWVVADGQKHSEYQHIRRNELGSAEPNLQFSPDSQLLVYVAGSGNRFFVVSNGEESDAFQSITPKIIFNARGDKLAYLGQGGSDAPNRRTIVVDGRTYSAPHTLRLDSFVFSPDGSRHAWFVSRTSPNHLFLDGEELDYNNSSILFSPDGQHAAVIGKNEKQNIWGIFLNGTLVHDQKASGNLQNYRAFTPDSRHFYWTASVLERQAGGPQVTWTLYIDGQPAVETRRPHSSLPFLPSEYHPGGDMNFDALPVAWHQDVGGTLSFLQWDGAAVKRFRVTPSASTSVASIPAATVPARR